MDKTHLLDTFAGLALQALIAKFPLIDNDGEFGKKMSDEDKQKVMSDLARSAYEYASLMLIARVDSLEWLRENETGL